MLNWLLPAAVFWLLYTHIITPASLMNHVSPLRFSQTSQEIFFNAITSTKTRSCQKVVINITSCEGDIDFSWFQAFLVWPLLLFILIIFVTFSNCVELPFIAMLMVTFKYPTSCRYMDFRYTSSFLTLCHMLTSKPAYWYFCACSTIFWSILLLPNILVITEIRFVESKNF